MTDKPLFAIARALRFIGLCIFYAKLFELVEERQEIAKIVDKEYVKP